MSRVLALFLAGLAFAQEDEVSREAVRGYRHPWEGFGPGSQIVFRETKKEASFDAERNQTVFRDRVTQHVWRITSAYDDRVVLRMEGGGLESEVPIYLERPGIFRGKGEARGEEEIRVGEKSYRCAVTVIRLDPGGEAGQATTIWRCPEAPGWAVRVLSETLVRGKRNTWEEELLVAEDQKVAVGDREIACRVVQVTTEVEGGVRTVRKEWRADGVPGRVVRRKTRYFAGGRENEGAASQMEIVSYVAKR